MPPPTQETPAKGPPPAKLPPPKGKQSGPTPGGGASYKARVEALLRKYDPAKVNTVDAMMVKFSGNEQQLIAALVKRYGPEPEPQPGSPTRGKAPPGKTASPAGEGGPAKAPPGKKAPPASPAGEGGPAKAPPGKKAPPASPAGEGGPAKAPPGKKAPPASPEDQSSNDMTDCRAVLTIFYEKFAPEKLETLDEILTVFGGREVQLYRSLEQRYKCPGEIQGIQAQLQRNDSVGESAAHDELHAAKAPAIPSGQERIEERAATDTASPTSPTSTGAGGSPDSELRTLLCAFYRQHAPDKLASVDDVLRAFAGREQQMIHTLEERYKCKGAFAELQQAGANSPDGGGEVNERVQRRVMAKQRLVSILQQHAPENIPLVDDMLAKFEGQEDTLVETVEKKYTRRVAPSEDVAKQGRTAAAENPQETRPDSGGVHASEGARIRTTPGPGSAAPPVWLDRALPTRDRLVAFYALHSPLDLPKVNHLQQLIETGKATDLEIFEKMYEKYARDLGELSVLRDAVHGADAEVPINSLRNSDSKTYAAAHIRHAVVPRGQQEEQQRHLTGDAERTGEPPSMTSMDEPPSFALMKTPWLDESLSVRSRLERFYERYNPHEMHKVDVAMRLLTTGKATEQDLFNRLFEKYDLDAQGLPKDAAAPHRAQLLALCCRFAPDKLPLVEDVLRTYAGREEEMFGNLHKQYGIRSVAEYMPRSKQEAKDGDGASAGAGAGGGGSGSDDCPRATRLAAHFGLSPHYVKHLRKVHGSDENALLLDILSVLFPDALADALADRRHLQHFVTRRMAQFYSFHNPPQVQRIPSLLAPYRGMTPLTPLGDMLIHHYGDVLQAMAGTTNALDWDALACATADTAPTTHVTTASQQQQQQQQQQARIEEFAVQVAREFVPEARSTPSNLVERSAVTEVLHAAASTEGLVDVAEVAVETLHREEERRRLEAATHTGVQTESYFLGPSYRSTKNTNSIDPNAPKPLFDLQKERYQQLYGADPIPRGPRDARSDRWAHRSEWPLDAAPTTARFDEFDEAERPAPRSPLRDSTSRGALLTAWAPPEPCSRCDDLVRQLDDATEKLHKLKRHYEREERHRAIEELAASASKSSRPCSGCEELQHQVRVLSRKLHQVRAMRQQFHASQDHYGSLLRPASRINQSESLAVFTPSLLQQQQQQPVLSSKDLDADSLPASALLDRL